MSMLTRSDATAADTEFTGVRAVVTGGTRGIGGATTRRLAAAGARVVAVARTQAPVPAGVTLVTADLSTAAGTDTAAAQALDRLGGVDVLVDNAGRNTAVPAGPLAATEADWAVNLEANLLSAVRMDRALVPHMVAQGHGAVVHVSSGASRFPQPNAVPYAAAKAALDAYSKGLATQVAPHGVRVTSVLPGMIETGALTATLQREATRTGRDVEAVRADLLTRLAAPLGRAGSPEEVAELIAFLVSPRASYLTGIRISVDGGQLPTL